MSHVRLSKRIVRLALVAGATILLAGPSVVTNVRNSMELARLRARLAAHGAHQGSLLIADRSVVSHLAGSTASCDFLVVQLRCMEKDADPREVYAAAAVEGVSIGSLRAPDPALRILATPAAGRDVFAGTDPAGEPIEVVDWDRDTWSPRWESIVSMPEPVRDLASTTRGTPCARPYLVMVLDSGHEGRLDPRCW